MKWTVAFGIIGWLVYSSAFAIPPVTLSTPSPAISSVYNANTSTLITYTIKNNVPKSLPISVSGISNGIQRTPVSNDCGNALPIGPSTCHIGLNINPSNSQIGSQVKQTLRIDYQGRAPLTSSISFSVVGNYAFVTPTLSATSIYQFLLGSDGRLLSYTIAYNATGSQRFGQMTFATVSGVQYAYILDPQGDVYRCSSNSNGSFNLCISMSTFAPGTQPRSIAFATFNAQYAYILDPSNNFAYQCALDTTGNFSGCIDYNLSIYSINAPYGIAFATDVNGTQHAYIASADDGFGNGTVSICSINNNGSFNICTPTPSAGAPIWIPTGVAFTQMNGVQYAYVADNGTGAIGTGHVYRCALNSDGSFVNCTQTPINDSSLTNWYPYFIAFQTVNGTKYAYVVNSTGSIIGNIYRCALDNNGLLTNCVMTPDAPPLPWQPSGIAF